MIHHMWKEIQEYIFEIKKGNIKHIFASLPIGETQIEAIIENESKAFEVYFNQNVEAITNCFNELEIEQTPEQLERIINHSLRLMNIVTGGTLKINDELILNKFYKEISTSIKPQTYKERTMLLKTLNLIVPEFMKVRKERNGKYNNLHHKELYENFFNLSYSHKPTGISIFGQEPLTVEKILNKDPKEESVIFNNIDQYIQDHYTNSLIQMFEVSSEEIDDTFKELFMVNLLAKYNIIDQGETQNFDRPLKPGDLNNVDPKTINIKPKEFDKIAKGLIQELSKGNIKTILEKFQTPAPIDALGVFQEGTSLVIDENLYQTYCNELEYTTMRHREFSQKLDFIGINKYARSLITCFLSYHKKVFNKKVNKFFYQNASKINGYYSFIEDISNQLSNLPKDWEQGLIDKLPSMFTYKNLKPKTFNISDLLVKKSTSKNAIKQSINYLINNSFLESRRGNINIEHLEALNQKILNYKLIHKSCIEEYTLAVNSLKNYPKSIIENLNQKVDKIAKCIIESASIKYFEVIK